MNDPFAQGPLVFPPRRQARAANRFMVGFFVFFILVGWSLPLMGGERGRGFFLFIAAICTACFGFFLSLVAQALRDTQEPVTADTDGLVFRGQRIPWGEIASAESVSRPEPAVVVRLRSGGKVTLRTVAYDDGPELGRIVQARVVRPAVLPDESRTYRPQSLAFTAVGLGIYLVMAVGLGLFQLRTPMPPHARVHPAVLQLGILTPLVLWMAASSLSRYVQLDARQLTVGSLFGRTVVALSTVDAIELTDQGVVVRAGSRKLSVAKGFADFPELRDRLLALSPKGTTEPEPKIVTESKIVTGSVVYAPHRFAWLVPFSMGLFILAIGLPGVVMGLVTAATRLGAGLVLAGICSVPLLLGLAALAYTVEARTRYVVDDEGFERQGAFRPRRVRWSEIERTWRAGSKLEALRVQAGGEVVGISPDFLADAPGLIQTIESRSASSTAGSPSVEGEAFGPSDDWKAMSVFLILCGVLFLGGSIPAFTGALGRDRPGDAGAGVIMGFLFAGMGAGLVALAAFSLTARYVPRLEGLEVVTIRKTRLLRWSDITRAETALLEGKGSRIVLTLEHPEGAVKINTAMTRDFDRLKGYVFARVRPEVIREPKN